MTVQKIVKVSNDVPIPIPHKTVYTKKPKKLCIGVVKKLNNIKEVVMDNPRKRRKIIVIDDEEEEETAKTTVRSVDTNGTDTTWRFVPKDIWMEIFKCVPESSQWALANVCTVLRSIKQTYSELHKVILCAEHTYFRRRCDRWGWGFTKLHINTSKTEELHIKWRNMLGISPPNVFPSLKRLFIYTDSVDHRIKYTLDHCCRPSESRVPDFSSPRIFALLCRLEEIHILSKHMIDKDIVYKKNLITCHRIVTKNPAVKITLLSAKLCNGCKVPMGAPGRIANIHTIGAAIGDGRTYRWGEMGRVSIHQRHWYMCVVCKYYHCATCAQFLMKPMDADLDWCSSHANARICDMCASRVYKTCKRCHKLRYDSTRDVPERDRVRHTGYMCRETAAMRKRRVLRERIDHEHKRKARKNVLHKKIEDCEDSILALQDGLEHHVQMNLNDPAVKYLHLYYSAKNEKKRMDRYKKQLRDM